MKVPRWVFRMRSFLLSPPLVFAAFWFRFETENALLVWPLAVFILLAGMAIRIWAKQHLHYSLRKSRPRQLTDTGPYKFVRNPLYVGNILIGVGATVASKLLWLAPVTLLWWIAVYSLVVRYEESHLLQQHGEAYRNYMSEVPRWFPRTISFRNAQLVNGFFGKSVLAESRCLFALLPFVLKEIISLSLGR